MPVYAFLHDDYSDWELGYLLPELRTPPASPQIPKRPREVVTTSVAGRPVRSSGGLRVAADVAIEEIAAADVDALVLPGGTFWRDFDNPDLDALVSSIRARDKGLGAICAATAYLARLGVLDGAAHTSNSCAFLRERAPSYGGAAHYRRQLAVRDGNLVTASGLGAVDFAYELLLLLEVYPPRVADVWLRAFRYGEDPFAE
jgi:putative intracellular protease/amidase